MLAQPQRPPQLQRQDPPKMEQPLRLLRLLLRLLSLPSTQDPGIGDVKRTTMQPAKQLTDSYFSIITVAKVLASSMSEYPSPTISLLELTLFSTWGNSLSYASADGTTGSASPQTLADTLIGDDVEFVVMTDNPCANGDCGTVRPGTVAYRKCP